MSENAVDLSSVRALVENYETLRGQVEEIEKGLKELKAQRDAAEHAVIAALLDAMEHTGIDDLTVKVGGFKYGASAKEYYGIPKAEQDAAFPLLRELGMGDLIVEKVGDRTLSKELREISEMYREQHPNSTENFPAEYRPLLSHLNKYPKPQLSRRKA